MSDAEERSTAISAVRQRGIMHAWTGSAEKGLETWGCSLLVRGQTGGDAIGDHTIHTDVLSR